MQSESIFFDEVKKQIQANKDEQEKRRRVSENQKLSGFSTIKMNWKASKSKTTKMMKDEPYYVTLERHKMVESVYLEKDSASHCEAF